MTARERIEFLLDDGTFEEFDRFKKHRSLDFGHGKSAVPRRRSCRRSRADRRATGLSSLRRISRSLEARCPKPTPKRSARSWTWR